MKRLLVFTLTSGILASCTHPEKPRTAIHSSSRSISKETTVHKREIEPKQAPAPAEKLPDLANTIWIGTNFEGEQYEVTFHVEGHVGKGFTVKTPTGTIDGFVFYFVGQPEHHGRSGATTC